MGISLRILCMLLIAGAATGCYRFLSSDGGGQVEFDGPRIVDPRDVALPSGYRIEAVAEGLTFPTGVTFDENGGVYVVESGYSYGEIWTRPRLLKIERDGGVRVIAEGGINGPWNGVDYANGNFYVAEGGELLGGRILEIAPNGETMVLIRNLPSTGDHHTNGPAIGPDGDIYFGIGTYTNSGVVGNDNYEFGWLKRYPSAHDIPGQDVVLAGENFPGPNPFTKDPADLAVTGAFVPFGTKTARGQVIPGRVPCNGAIMKISPTGGEAELVAWGFRNPFGLAFSPEGELFATDNMYDVRGFRPVFGSGDLLWRVEAGVWYGWPDFHGGHPLTRDRYYVPPSGTNPRFVLAEHPNDPPAPVATLGVHSSAVGLDFSRSENFGYVGEAFIAEFGDQAPVVGKVLSPVGYKVVRVDVETGEIHDFAVNRGGKQAPASYLRTGGLERPIDAAFDPASRSLYVVDFGVLLMDDASYPVPGTGVLWRITREGAAVGGER